MEALIKELRNLKLNDSYLRKPVRKHIYEFAVMFAAIVVGYGCWQVWKNTDIVLAFACVAAALILIFFGKVAPRIFLYPWRSWMVLGLALGGVVSGVILSLLWFVMVIPIAIILKISGIKVMDTGFRSEQSSYWRKRDPKKDDFKLLERQF